MPMMLAYIKLKITVLVHKHVVPLPKMIKASYREEIPFQIFEKMILKCMYQY